MAPTSPPSSESRLTLALDVQHEKDVLDLIAKLLAIEYERGKLRAQLEFHLNVRTLARTHPPAPVTPKPIGRPPSGQSRRPGQLEQQIVEELARCDDLTAREIAISVEANPESVRQTMLRLVKAAKVVKTGRRYKLAEPADAE